MNGALGFGLIKYLSMEYGGRRMRFLIQSFAVLVAVVVLATAHVAHAQNCPNGGGGGGGGGGAGGGGGGPGGAGSNPQAGRGFGATISPSIGDDLMRMQMQFMQQMQRGGGQQVANNPKKKTKRPRNLMTAYQRRLYEIAKREMRRKRLIARLGG